MKNQKSPETLGVKASQDLARQRSNFGNDYVANGFKPATVHCLLAVLQPGMQRGSLPEMMATMRLCNHLVIGQETHPLPAKLKQTISQLWHVFFSEKTINHESHNTQEEQIETTIMTN